MMLTFFFFWQIWVKTPEVLARDRLLGSFSVSLSLLISKIQCLFFVIISFLFALFSNEKQPYAIKLRKWILNSTRAWHEL
jgi:hypothetical protein